MKLCMKCCFCCILRSLSWMTASHWAFPPVVKKYWSYLVHFKDKHGGACWEQVNLNRYLMGTLWLGWWSISCIERLQEVLFISLITKWQRQNSLFIFMFWIVEYLSFIVFVQAKYSVHSLGDAESPQTKNRQSYILLLLVHSHTATGVTFVGYVIQTCLHIADCLI